jgi:hypothetical protein
LVLQQVAKVSHNHAETPLSSSGKAVITGSKGTCAICDFQLPKDPAIVSPVIDYKLPLLATQIYFSQQEDFISDTYFGHTGRGPPCFI